MAIPRNSNPTLPSRKIGARNGSWVVGQSLTSIDSVSSAATWGIPIGNLGCNHEDLHLLYSRHMYSAGNGLAPWSPSASFSTGSLKSIGLAIGDVGYQDETTGTFLHLFNIFCDPQPPGYAFVVPDNFAPIQPPLDDWEVRTSPDHFPKGTVLTSKGLKPTQELQTAL